MCAHRGTHISRLPPTVLEGFTGNLTAAQLSFGTSVPETSVTEIVSLDRARTLSHNPSLRRPPPFPFRLPGNRGGIALRPCHNYSIPLARRAPEPLAQVSETAAAVFAFEQNAARAPLPRRGAKSARSSGSVGNAIVEPSGWSGSSASRVARHAVVPQEAGSP